ncbi:hypothetical protein FQN54_004661 [Arachnomyces sp. PD_36]|nr:hypothetical protein FQN54_004661 [Arachnomyces sp. PD_36]
MRFLLAQLSAFALLALHALAHPKPELPVYNVTGDWIDPDIYRRQDTDLKTPLRVLPLGASITWGLVSGDDNGYRKALRDAMRFAGHPVDMVGSRRHGTMNDNQNEGWPGFIIDEVHEKAKAVYKVKPNLVLINAGTNDCVKQIDFIRQPQRMTDMVLDIFDNIPGVTVILSGLLPSEAANPCTKLMNYNYGRIVERLASEGKKIVFADTYNGYMTLDDLADGTHPTDFGYLKLASIWWHAFTKASQEGFISIPEDNGQPDDPATTVCDKEYANGIGPTKIQVGSGWGNGDYSHDGRERGRLLKFNHNANQLPHLTSFFADLNGDGFDDFIWYFDSGDSPGEYEVWFNTQNEDAPFEDAENVNIQVNNPCGWDGVRWGDVNADGLDDFICITEEGDMDVSINRRDKSAEAPDFEALPRYKTRIEGRLQEHVRLGDVDGDGRLDYCVIADNGDIECWRNGWIFDEAKYWQYLGVIFTGKDKGDIDGVRLVDLNGDHRADWLYVNDDGSVETYINNRGHDKSLVPDWRDAGKTHGGFPDLENNRNYIKFGRMTATGKADYMWSQYAPGNSEEVYTEIKWWENHGGGGTILKSDNNHYCDMDGDGSDDYVAISPIGEFQLFRNIHDPPNWGQDGIIFNQYWPHKRIRIADIDGDGKCDIIFLQEDATIATWYKTQYSDDDGFDFTRMGTIPEISSCSQRDGVGLFDLAVRFADINGDGKADRLCLDPDGRTFAYVSTESGYKDMKQVKTPEERDRANLRFVDINGDKRADMVWLDKFGGDAEVWYNENDEPAEGTDSSMTWRPAGKAYLQSARGECIHLVNLAGKGRADMVDVDPHYNTAVVSFTPPCPGGVGGDDGEIGDPGLPALEGPDGFPRFPRFFAMGDSYSAGIGAGDRIKDAYDPENKCARATGAYSAWLHNEHEALKSGKLDFISCSGDKTRHILSEAHYSRQRQLDILKSKVPTTEYTWGTLSIGGNDVGFASIAKGCLLGIPGYDCEKSIAKADAMVNGNGPEAEKFTNDLTAVYSGILDTAQTQHFTLVVTGYASFFNEHTSRCDKETLNPVPLWPGAPKLLREKRARLNRLTEQLNERLRVLVAEVDSRFPDKYIRFFDINPQFDTHRFCDVDENGNDREEWKDDSWFLTAFGNDINPEGEVIPLDDNVEGSFDLRTFDTSQCPPPDAEEDELGILDVCDYARFFQENPDLQVGDEGDNADTITTFFEPVKALHPKSIAHAASFAGHPPPSPAATGRGITKKWLEQWGYFVPVTPP